MAPRYPSFSDAYPSNDDSSHSYFHQQANPVLHSNTIEFKPRLDLWASQSAWGCSTRDIPSSSNQHKQRRRGRFAPTLIESKPHIHAADISEEEKQAAWFTRSEFKQMRFERQHTIDDFSIDLEEEWGLETSA